MSLRCRQGGGGGLRAHLLVVAPALIVATVALLVFQPLFAALVVDFSELGVLTWSRRVWGGEPV